jgi:hypothetical protein
MRWLNWCMGGPAPGDLNFCLLFWVTLFSPVCALLQLIGIGGKWGVRTLRTIEVAQRTGDRIAAWSQRHKTVWERLAALAALAGVSYAVGLIAYELYKIAWWVLLIPGNLAWLIYAAVKLLPVSEIERVLSAGYHATKNRTCPQVVFTDEREAA